MLRSVTELLTLTQLSTSYCKFAQLRWVGHVIRMPSNRLSHRILYGKLTNGQRLPGGPKLWYMVYIRRILNKYSVGVGRDLVD